MSLFIQAHPRAQRQASEQRNGRPQRGDDGHELDSDRSRVITVRASRAFAGCSTDAPTAVPIAATADRCDSFIGRSSEGTVGHKRVRRTQGGAGGT